MSITVRQISITVRQIQIWQTEKPLKFWIFFKKYFKAWFHHWQIPVTAFHFDRHYMTHYSPHTRSTATTFIYIFLFIYLHFYFISFLSSSSIILSPHRFTLTWIQSSFETSSQTWFSFYDWNHTGSIISTPHFNTTSTNKVSLKIQNGRFPLIKATVSMRDETVDLRYSIAFIEMHEPTFMVIIPKKAINDDDKTGASGDDGDEEKRLILIILFKFMIFFPYFVA